ncbi:MAG: flavin reductase [Saprospiraceae bacterium]|nr:flavin reductase [Saprospiraceae bacterium]
MNLTTFTKEQISNMDRRFRATFINSLGGFKSVVLVGTKDPETGSNLAIMSSFFHIGANPALCGLIFRPESEERHTLKNILKTGSYTINHIREEFIAQAHQTSAKYPYDVSEFEVTGLNEFFLDDFQAPFVLESSIRLGVNFRERHDLTINGTVMILGEIVYVHCPSECISGDGFVNLEKAGTITCSGLDSYHNTKLIKRLPYAKP